MELPDEIQADSQVHDLPLHAGPPRVAGHARRAGRFADFFARYAEEAPASTDGGLRALRKQMDIQTALEALPTRQREVLVLAVHQGQTYEEISQALSIPVGTVKSRVFNALKSMQERFRDEP